MDLEKLSTPPKTAAEAHAPAIALGAACLECPLYGCRQGPVLPEHHPNPKLVIVGEAPGLREVEEGRPFTGPSGVELNIALGAAGLSRDETHITNVILCRPGEDFDLYIEQLERAWKRSAQAAEAAGAAIPSMPHDPRECCRPRLVRELDHEPKPSTVLAVGQKALVALARYFGVAFDKEGRGRPVLASIKAQHGSPVKMPDGRTLASSLHPAFAMRKNRQYTQVIRDNIARAANIALRGGEIDWHEPEYITLVPKIVDHDPNVLSMSVAAVLNAAAASVGLGSAGRPDEAVITALTVLAKLETAQRAVTVDIETNGIDAHTCLIRCIGLGATINGEEVVISVPFRWRDNRRFWATDDQEQAVTDAVRRVLTKCSLVFHNGIFDTTVLIRCGFMPDDERIWFDTLIAHKNTDANDLPHDLGFVVRQYLEAPLWKKDVDHKAALGVATDYDLALYNQRDVLSTLRIAPLLRDRVLACGNSAQFELDAKLAVVARDMGRNGLFVDEAVRGDLSLKFNKLTEQLRAKFQQLVGYELNPRSPQQLRSWLYDKLALTKYDAQGFEIADDDEVSDPSTGTNALFQLLDLGVDKATEEAINTLLEFRACDKLRGTYIDNLRVKYDAFDSPFGHGPQLTAQSFPTVGSVTYDGVEILPVRPTLSRLFVGWKINIPTGRWACEPTVHNWPSRGWMVDGKPTNMRRMIVAPPGHVIVGADYEQIELRIYGVIANDRYVLKSFRDGLEPHCLNAATIMAEREEDIQALYEEFYRKHKHGTPDEQKEMKYIRTVAKRVCIAEGSLVLVLRHGQTMEVPIETVDLLDKVWDGVEWVSHGGVIYQGEKDVIEYEGLWATPDHVVWTEDGEKMELQAARAGRRRLARAASGRHPIRFVRDDVRGLAGAQPSARQRPLHRLWDGVCVVLRQLGERQVGGLSGLQVGSAAVGGPVVASHVYEQRADALHEPEAPELSGLRWAWDRVSLLLDRGRRALDHETSRAPAEVPTAGYLHRSDRQQRPLRARESALDDSDRERPEHTTEEAPTARLGLSSGGVAFLTQVSRGEDRRRADAPADYSGRARLRGVATTQLADGRRTARVYDILNAGPRRRFTASERMCSNCYLKNYGGEEDKLFSAMTAERDKATNRRVFPGLKKERVDTWEERWDRRHPEKTEWHRRVAQTVRAQGYVEAPIGAHRKRFFIGGPNKKNAPPNMEIQGAAAEIANAAVLKIAEAIPFGCWSPYTGLCLQVHDYLAVIVPEARAKEAAKILEECMYAEMPTNEGWLMPFPAEAVVSKSWADNA